MKITMKSLAKLGMLSALVLLSASPVSAQTSVGKTILDKLNAGVKKLESTCASDIKKFCSKVTPGEGRMVYCLQAFEDQISSKCAFALEETASSILTASDALKDGVVACKAEINDMCGKVKPGEGRIATCLLENKSTVSTGCADAIAKVEALASDKEK